LKVAVHMLIISACFPQGARASTCTPNDNAARILKSPSPNDIHPDWSGESYVGLSWHFEPTGYAGDQTGDYLKGNLFSPRGELVNSGVFILRDEWSCK
jgi:hypothetical protein